MGNFDSLKPRNYHEGMPTFPVVENLFLLDCDKNFVFFWLNCSTFPNVKKIYLSSHPCDPNVFNRFIAYKTYMKEKEQKEQEKKQEAFAKEKRAKQGFWEALQEDFIKCVGMNRKTQYTFEDEDALLESTDIPIIYLDDWVRSFKSRWAKDNEHVVPLSVEDFKKALDEIN
jgi:hypothetical protein